MLSYVFSLAETKTNMTYIMLHAMYAVNIAHTQKIIILQLKKLRRLVGSEEDLEINLKISAQIVNLNLHIQNSDSLSYIITRRYYCD